MKKTKKMTTRTETEPGVNTLVRHKKLKTLGIGCIAKVHPKHYTVNWGMDDHAKCLKTAIEVVDTSKCKTVSFHDYKSRVLMSDPNTASLDYCIIGNIVQHFVGIGWIDRSVVTEQDLLTLPRVVDNGQ